jgi:hypothetical protein
MASPPNIRYLNAPSFDDEVPPLQGGKYIKGHRNRLKGYVYKKQVVRTGKNHATQKGERQKVIKLSIQGPFKPLILKGEGEEYYGKQYHKKLKQRGKGIPNIEPVKGLSSEVKVKDQIKQCQGIAYYTNAYCQV